MQDLNFGTHLAKAILTFDNPNSAVFLYRDTKTPPDSDTMCSPTQNAYTRQHTKTNIISGRASTNSRYPVLLFLDERVSLGRCSGRWEEKEQDAVEKQWNEPPHIYFEHNIFPFFFFFRYEHIFSIALIRRRETGGIIGSDH